MKAQAVLIADWDNQIKGDVIINVRHPSPEECKKVTPELWKKVLWISEPFELLASQDGIGGG